ncbi:hypothetical protein PK28_00935 [Hymenobacter sp. DG25B]|jgi:hypothetical protein|uniref:DUF7009 family protein n=1 Tax=Hymenobacter sp. DG25B TaxID=1385664 RepID=UPI000541242F|nr:hypothetical protein [Hymenobacter sp. DG25B]AIZ62603.1 hypothetical protein PK28_00935 [Hymenobacter sp. DG25B]
MKLRLEDNTLRLRLSPEEISDFSRLGRLQTVVPLGPLATDCLTYTLERDAATPGSTPGIRYEGATIRVLLPAALSDSWTSTEAVSLEGQVEVLANQVLRILVEKDLGCKH